MRKFTCTNCGFVKVFYGKEARKKQKKVRGFTCPRCGKKQTDEDVKRKRGKGPKPPGERRKRVKKEVVKERPKPIVPQPHIERPERQFKPPQPTRRTLEEAVISSLNIKVSAPISIPNLEVDESKAKNLDQYKEKLEEPAHIRKSPFEVTSDKIKQYLSGLNRAQMVKEVAEGVGITKSFAYSTLQLMEVFGTVQKVERGGRHYYLPQGVYSDEQILDLLPTKKVKRKSRSRSRSIGRSRLPVCETFLREHLSDMRTRASSGEGPPALAMIGLTQQEIVEEEKILTEELPRELDMSLYLGLKFLFSYLKIKPFATVEHLPKNVRKLNQMQMKYLKEQLKRLDGYDRIERFRTVFAEFSALERRSYGNIFYFSAGTNPWERVYRVIVDDSLSLEMKEPVKSLREWGRSKYDPIIDRFIELGRDLAEISVEGKKPSYVASQLQRRIRDRGLEMGASSVGGFVYLENNNRMEDR